jgi:hypothetical protein
MKLLPRHATLGSVHGWVIEMKSVLPEPVDVIPRNTRVGIETIKKELCSDVSLVTVGVMQDFLPRYANEFTTIYVEDLQWLACVFVDTRNCPIEYRTQTLSRNICQVVR